MKVFQLIESMLDVCVLVSTFVEGTGWLIRCNRVRLGAKNNELFLPGETRLHKFKKTKVARQLPFVKTPKKYALVSAFEIHKKSSTISSTSHSTPSPTPYHHALLLTKAIFLWLSMSSKGKGSSSTGSSLHTLVLTRLQKMEHEILDHRIVDNDVVPTLLAAKAIHIPKPIHGWCVSGANVSMDTYQRFSFGGTEFSQL